MDGKVLLQMRTESAEQAAWLRRYNMTPKEKIMAVKCPRCSAGKQRRCTNKDGTYLSPRQFGIRHQCHAERVKLAHPPKFVWTNWPVGRLKL